MQYTVPQYYSKFQCLAGSCPDTCCAGWQIGIDKHSLRRYRKVGGTLRNRLYNEIDKGNQVFRQYEGRCAFLNEENLCDLYLEGGKSLFCRTCRMYPRHIEEFEGLREVTLSLSCPGAAELILRGKECVKFVTKNIPREEKGEYENFDFLLFTKLMDTRDVMYQILQERDTPFKVRMAMVLALGHDLQQRMNRNALFGADSLLKRYQGRKARKWFAGQMAGYEGQDPQVYKKIMENAFSILDCLEVLRKDWRRYLRQKRDVLSRHKWGKEAAIQGILPKFYIQSGNRDNAGYEIQFEVMWEQLMVYFLSVYFCGAVYDGDAWGKVKFSFFNTIFIREMADALWIQNGGDISAVEIQEAACRYSREVEHSDFNRRKMEELLGNEKLFGIEALLKMI